MSPFKANFLQRAVANIKKKLSTQGAPMTDRNAMIVATIRTAVPAAVGALIAQLIVAVPAVGDGIAWLDAQIAAAGYPGVTTQLVLTAAAIGLTTAIYYRSVRELGKRWPLAERWLLGSAKKPNYDLTQVTIDGAVKWMTRAEYREYTEGLPHDATDEPGE